MSGDGAANLFFLNDQGAGTPNPTDAIGASVDTVGEYFYSLRAWERARTHPAHAERDARPHRLRPDVSSEHFIAQPQAASCLQRARRNSSGVMSACFKIARNVPSGMSPG
jgi:hypothetical protein